MNPTKIFNNKLVDIINKELHHTIREHPSFQSNVFSKVLNENVKNIFPGYETSIMITQMNHRINNLLFPLYKLECFNIIKRYRLFINFFMNNKGWIVFNKDNSRKYMNYNKLLNYLNIYTEITNKDIRIEKLLFEWF